MEMHAPQRPICRKPSMRIAKPSQETLDAARKAWLEARPWYQQTEGFRFGNAIVDDWKDA